MKNIFYNFLTKIFTYLSNMIYQTIGLGTYKLQGDLCTKIIKKGLNIGYRQIDTAQLYHNHEQISEGIIQSSVPRDEIFIISKIQNSNIKKIKMAESINNIKKELNTDFLDLLLLHNPVKNYALSWKELIVCKEQMNVKNIGVSNFNINHLENIINQTNYIPFLNQIEFNIFNQQQQLIEYHKKNNIITQSHTTLTNGILLENNELRDFSKLLNLSPIEIMYKFVMDQNIGILPRTSKIKHLLSNWNLQFKPLLYDNNFSEYYKNYINTFDIGYKIY